MKHRASADQADRYSNKFYKFSFIGRADEGNPDQRWSTDWDQSLKMDWSLQAGQVIDSWDETTAVFANTPGPPEDMPWHTVPLVSDRLRQLLMMAAPRQAQYLPVRMMYKDRPLPHGQYWIANWLHMVDCFDREKSIYSTVPEPDGTTRFSFDRLVIRLDAIPKDVLICRVKHFENVAIIRRDIREIIERAGMTGCQFYDISQI